jgi:N-acetylneuraminic acid mutarotase
MDYDKDTGKLILFGGRNGEGTLNDIWIFDSINNKWSHRTPSTTLRPSTRTARSIAYIDKKFITVGGINSTTPLSMNHETWIYSLANDAWVQSPTLADSTGYGISPNFVYDDVNKVVVLFGGRTGSAEGHVNRTGETWEFDVNHGTWTQIFPDTSPSPRKHHALVYDSTNRKAIMFGGEISTGFSNETWSYDASTDSWTQLFPDLSPSPRSNIEMVYDAQNHQVILFGGFLPGGNPIKITNETWVYDITANTWFQVNSPQVPEPRFHHAMVYDPVGKKVVMFGGGITLCQSPHCFITSGFVNDTWVYK